METNQAITMRGRIKHRYCDIHHFDKERDQLIEKAVDWHPCIRRKEVVMPYEYVWIPAPTNMNLPVSPELPTGFVENYVWSFVKQLKVASNSKYEAAYFCHSNECNGWIFGEPMENEEYIILSGRDGTAYYCCRCGREISFVTRRS